MEKHVLRIKPAQDGMFAIEVFSPTLVYKGCVNCEDVDELLNAVGDIYEEGYPNPGFREN